MNVCQALCIIYNFLKGHKNYFYILDSNMTKSFTFKNLTIELHPQVYEPAEDTFLLADSIYVSEVNSIFELGSGSGLIALYCASLGANVICSDINPFAVELIKKNFLVNKDKIKGSFDVRIGDLFSVLDSKDSFDVIIFNPPYLPTTKKDLVGGLGWFDKAVNGGADGLNITKHFINHVSGFLKKNGRVYFVFSSLCSREKLESLIKKNNFIFEIVNSCRFNDETLDVYCLEIKK
jgi:release factor glutamine methyltransferase